MNRYAGSQRARARCAEILNERAEARRLHSLFFNEDGTRNRLGKLLATVARSEPSGFQTARTADIETLLGAGYITYGLHPMGGHRADHALGTRRSGMTRANERIPSDEKRLAVRLAAIHRLWDPGRARDQMIEYAIADETPDVRFSVAEIIRRRRSARYFASPKGKATQRAYKQSDKGRANYRRAQSKYGRSPRGRATTRRWYEKRGRDYQRDYQTSRIMRQHKERWRNSEAGKVYRLFYHLSGEAAADQRRHKLRKLATISDSKWSIIERKLK